MSLAAWMPSSFRFFSICLLRARAARSSAEEVHPILQVPSVQNVAPADDPSRVAETPHSRHRPPTSTGGRAASVHWTYHNPRGPGRRLSLCSVQQEF
ncbi:hypothetical protein BDFB_009589 [Asbolus verrucosus]|uniref:Secreted protein n=1 Tax=Asbolus verrucosus TaxID=1661398 RepID=A0A482VB18_ASBVE|nr:hypothetical protein BDFB_009589 [Asbolus verrucosus]